VGQPYYLYHTLYRDKNGILWIGTRNQSPMNLDENAGKVVFIYANEDNILKKRAHDMACYYEDSYGNFWFTALDGIYLYNRNTQVFTKFLSATTYDVKEDQSGNIWFATGSGVLKFNVADSIITEMKNEKDNPNSISSNSVYKIMEDDIGNLWFATSDGVDIYSKPAYAFSHFTHIPGIANSPEGYVTTAVAEDKNSNLWLGYENDGLDYFNRKKATFSHYTHNPKNINSLACNKISALYMDGNSRLWIGLWCGIGFNMLNVNTHKFSFYRYYTKTQERDWYNDFAEDKNGNFYIGFWGANGLTGFDRDKGKFLKSYKKKFRRTFNSRLITHITVDQQGTLWLTTTNSGVHSYFPDTDTATSYFSDDSIPNGLISNNIIDITTDKFGNIWLINDRLQKFIPETGTFVSFGNANGLTTSELASILADNNGKIWVSTINDGIFKFNPDNKKFTQYVKQDGLESNSFTKARLKLKNGNLIFGCTNGFDIFDPDEIKENKVIPTPYFGRLYVFDHIISHDLEMQTKVTLKPEQNVFTVELLSSDLVNPERYSYECKLEGYDDGWVNIDNTQRTVRYAAVSPGSYKLYYRIGNRTGKWSSKTSSITFKIQSPYYLTWWFIALVVMTVVILLYFFIKQREFDLKQKHRNVELQQRLFRLQMNPHFIFNSLLAIQNFIYLHDRKEAGNYLSDFARLFRLILNNSKSEFILLDKEIETLNLYLKMQSLRYPDKFTYKIYIDPELDTEVIMIPPMLAQPMIENALEHGLYYKKGKGNIDIRFIHSNKNLIFEVEDNGIGITLAKKKNISKSKHRSSALNITRERVKVLSKRHSFFAIFEIKELKDDNGKVTGTKVIFSLPYKIRNLDKLHL
jgi:ligand-binding sensor domain-containing protein